MSKVQPWADDQPTPPTSPTASPHREVPYRIRRALEQGAWPGEVGWEAATSSREVLSEVIGALSRTDITPTAIIDVLERSPLTRRMRAQRGWSERRAQLHGLVEDTCRRER